MARNPFAAEAAPPPGVRKPPTPTGVLVMRIVTAISVLAVVGFAFAYYVPLQDAHTRLAAEHQALSSTHAETGQQLKQTTEQLLSTQSERDTLKKAAEDRAEKRKAADERVTGLTTGLETKLEKRVKNKQVAVSEEGESALITIDFLRLFRQHEANIHGPGRIVLCDVAKALQANKDVATVQVGAHMADSKVSNVILARDFSNTWELSAARAASAVHMLEKCGVEPKLLSAAGFAHHHPAEEWAKNSDGELRIEVRPPAQK